MNRHPNARPVPRGAGGSGLPDRIGVPVAEGARQMGAGAGRPAAPAAPACTSPSTTAAGSPTRSCCPTSAGHVRGVHGPLPRFFAGLGIAAGRVMTDNGPGCRGRDLDALLESEGVRHGCTRPCSPWQNGKAGRMNHTLAQEWQYARAWGSEAERADALPAFIECYNRKRPHSACGGLPPMSRIPGVNNLLAHNI